MRDQVACDAPAVAWLYCGRHLGLQACSCPLSLHASPSTDPQPGSSQDDELIKSCGRRDETPFYTPVRGFASARKAERQHSAPGQSGGAASAAVAAQQKPAVRLEYGGEQVRSLRSWLTRVAANAWPALHHCRW